MKRRVHLSSELLLYLPRENGKLKLVGVEYFKVDADQNLATDGDRPHGRRCFLALLGGEASALVPVSPFGSSATSSAG